MDCENIRYVRIASSNDTFVSDADKVMLQPGLGHSSKPYWTAFFTVTYNLVSCCPRHRGEVTVTAFFPKLHRGFDSRHHPVEGLIQLGVVKRLRKGIAGQKLKVFLIARDPLDGRLYPGLGNFKLKDCW